MGNNEEPFIVVIFLFVPITGQIPHSDELSDSQYFHPA